MSIVIIHKEWFECVRCEGTGKVECWECGGDKACMHCGASNRCATCDGTGTNFCDECEGAGGWEEEVGREEIA